jgi:CRISPR-associated protein Cas5t
MEFLRVEISAMTASFRYPMFVVSYQPTYPVPPISTIYGLLSAAKGAKVPLDEINIGYKFESRGKGTDLERMYEYGIGDSMKKPVHRLGTNIVQREFLYDCSLTLYLSDTGFTKYFMNPAYSLLLGRQPDLAYVKKIESVNLEKKDDVVINHTMIPFTGEIPGQVISLPSDFSDTAERKPLHVKSYAIITTPQHISNGYIDTDTGMGVYIHDFTSTGKTER